MAPFRRLDPETARQKLAEGAALVDIRDPFAHAQGHIEGTLHLSDDTLDAFLGGADRARPLLVYCYHGNSSQTAARFFAEQGFAEVYSLDGGYEEWARRFPETCRRLPEAP